MALSWVRLDCGFTQNRKVLELVSGRKFQAVTVYIGGLGYAGAQETDGLVPKGALPLLHGTVKQARELTEVGLWVPCLEGWLIKNWDEYQPSRQTSAERSERARNAANKRWEASKQ